jgi:hypothetical protein
MNHFGKKICFLFSALAVLFSCETDRITFNGPAYVRFDSEQQSFRESYSKVIQIPVHIVGPVQNEPLAITYNVSGTAREGVDYEFISEKNTVTIPAGEYFGYVKIKLINNANNILRSQDLTLTIIGSSNPQVRVGQGNAGIGKEHTLTITDECILSGDFKGTREGMGSEYVDDISITSEDCETYNLSNWNINLSIVPVDMPLIFIDNGDNTLTVPMQEGGFGNMQGSGAVDPVTREMSFNLILLEFDSAEFEFTLIPD